MSPRTACLAVTATGLRIGIAHQSPGARIEGDQVRLQAALLEPKTAQPRPLLLRLLGAVWGWL